MLADKATSVTNQVEVNISGGSSLSATEISSAVSKGIQDANNKMLDGVIAKNTR